MFDKTAQPESVWRPIYEKTGGTCAYCGVEVDEARYGKCAEGLPGAWIVEHWKPRSTFKADDPTKDDPDNLWVGCCSCNDAKGVLIGSVYISRRQQAGQPVNGKHPAVRKKILQDLAALGR